MSLKSAPFYWVICDGCGSRSPTEDSEVSAWSDAATAVEDAENGDWVEYERNTEAGETNIHLCYVCTPKTENGEPWEELP